LFSNVKEIASSIFWPCIIIQKNKKKSL
jgi:hypothetical protein